MSSMILSTQPNTSVPHLQRLRQHAFALSDRRSLRERGVYNRCGQVSDAAGGWGSRCLLRCHWSWDSHRLSSTAVDTEYILGDPGEGLCCQGLCGEDRPGWECRWLVRC